MESIVNGLKLVSITIKKLCDRNATLLTADTGISFLIRNLGQSPFELKLKSTLLTRVSERRTINSDVLQYLNNRNTTSLIPEFSSVNHKEVKKVLLQLGARLCEEVDNTEIAIDVGIEEVSAGADNELDQLLCNETMRLRKAPDYAGTGGITSEINLYNKSGVKGRIITRLYDSLLTVSPTSVEAERTFSVAGRRCTKVRARMSDAALNALICLHAYFKHPF